MLLFVIGFDIAFQNMVAYVMLPVVIFLLEKSLTITEVAVTPYFHWIRVRCIAALNRFCSAIRQSPSVVV